MKCKALMLIAIFFLSVFVAVAFFSVAKAVSWNNVETWQLQVRAPGCNDVASCNLNVSSVGSWHNVESWNINVAGSGSWHNVETWQLHVSTPTVPITFNLTILSGTGGSTSPVAGYYVVTNGSSVSITPFANVNYVFTSWTVNGSSDGSANPLLFTMGGNTTVLPMFTYVASWRNVESWNFAASTGSVLTWYDVESWNVSVYANSSTSGFPYQYTFLGTYDETSGILNSDNTTINVYPTFGTPFSITVGPPDYNATWGFMYKPSYFRIIMPNNMSRYYVPVAATETIYVFEPADPYYTYYISIVDTVGVSNAYVESYVYLNATSFTVERRQFTINNKIPFVLTQFSNYGFRLICDQGVTDFGRFIAGDYSIIPAFTFTVSTMNFAVAPITYSNITLSAVRFNDTWIQINYYDVGNKTESISVKIEQFMGGIWQTVYTDSRIVSQSYAGNYYDCEVYKDYVVTITVAHQTYGSLTWQIPCVDPLYQVNLWAGLTVLGQFPFDITQFFGFFIVLCVFGLFSAKDHVTGLIVAILVAAILALPPIHWLTIGWGTISIVFCFVILYALGRRKPS